MSKPTLIEVFKSVFSAAIGIQSEKNRKKDFQAQGSLTTYIIAGFVFTALFVIALILVVSAIM